MLNSIFARGVATRPASGAVLDLAITNTPDIFDSMAIGDAALGTAHSFRADRHGPPLNVIDTMESDHLPIRVTIPLANAPVPADAGAVDDSAHIRWNIDSADWAAYGTASRVMGNVARADCERISAHCSERFPERADYSAATTAARQAAVDDMWSIVKGSAIAAADYNGAVPRKRTVGVAHTRAHMNLTRIFKAEPWLIPLRRAANAARNRVQSSYRRYGLHGDPNRDALLAEQHRLRTAFRSCAREVQRLLWQRSVDDITDAATGALAWKAFHRIQPSSRVPLNGIVLTMPKPVPADAPAAASAPGTDRHVHFDAADHINAPDDAKRSGPADRLPPVLRPAPAAAAPQPTITYRGIDAMARHLANVCSTPATASKDDGSDALRRCDNGDATPPPTYGYDIANRPADYAAECNRSVTFAEVDERCNVMRTTGAYGPDSISPHFMKRSHTNWRVALWRLYRWSFEHGVLPIDWRSANVCCPYKGKGADVTSPSSFRPISLTSVVVKQLERILCIRLRKVIDPQIHPSQHGFRRDYSCDDHVFGLHDDIHSAWVDPKRRGMVCVFLDITAAFDSVWHARLLTKLWQFGVVGKLWRWLRAFLTDRRLRVIDGELFSAWVAITAGCPQGAVVSPDIFKVFIDDLPRHDSLASIAFRLFADDVEMHVKTITKSIGLHPRDLHTMNWRERYKAEHRIRSRALITVNNWAHDNGCRFKIPKCAAVQFGCAHQSKEYKALPRGSKARRDLTLRDTPLTMGGEVIPVVDTFQYLGVRFSANGRWDAHAQYVHQRVQAAMGAIRRLARMQRGPRTRVLRQLVNALVVPRIAYGAHVWHADSIRGRSLTARSFAMHRVRDDHHRGYADAVWQHRNDHNRDHHSTARAIHFDRDGNIAAYGYHPCAIVDRLPLAHRANRQLTAKGMAIRRCVVGLFRQSLRLCRSVHGDSVLAECGIADVNAITDRALISFIHRSMRKGDAHPSRVLIGHLLPHAFDRSASASFTGRHTLARLRLAVHDFHRLDRDGAAVINNVPDPKPPSLDDAIRASFVRFNFPVRHALWTDGNGRRVANGDGAVYTRRAYGRDYRHLRGEAHPPLAVDARSRRHIHGAADYLRAFTSRSAVIALARIRLNRSTLADSLRRRMHLEASADGICKRCHGANERDTAAHFFECMDDVNNHRLVAIRRKFPDLEPYYSHTASMLGERTHTAHIGRGSNRRWATHLRMLNAFYRTLVREGANP